MGTLANILVSSPFLGALFLGLIIVLSFMGIRGLMSKGNECNVEKVAVKSPIFGIELTFRNSEDTSETDDSAGEERLIIPPPRRQKNRPS